MRGCSIFGHLARIKTTSVVGCQPTASHQMSSFVARCVAWLRSTVYQWGLATSASWKVCPTGLWLSGLHAREMVCTRYLGERGVICVGSKGTARDNISYKITMALMALVVLILSSVLLLHGLGDERTRLGLPNTLYLRAEQPCCPLPSSTHASSPTLSSSILLHCTMLLIFEGFAIVCSLSQQTNFIIVYKGRMRQAFCRLNMLSPGSAVSPSAAGAANVQWQIDIPGLSELIVNLGAGGLKQLATAGVAVHSVGRLLLLDNFTPTTI